MLETFENINNFVTSISVFNTMLNSMDDETVSKYISVCETLGIGNLHENIENIITKLRCSNVSVSVDNVLTTTEVETADRSYECEFIRYNDPFIVDLDEVPEKVINDRVCKGARISCMNHLIFVSQDGYVYDHNGNEIEVRYTKPSHWNVRLIMPNMMPTDFRLVTLIAKVWITNERPNIDKYPRHTCGSQRPSTSNVIWYHLQKGGIKGFTGKKKTKEEKKEIKKVEIDPPTELTVNLSEDVQKAVVTALSDRNWSILKAQSDLIDRDKIDVSIYDMYLVKEKSHGVNDDDLSVVVRTIMEAFDYDIGKICDEVLEKTGKLIGHPQRRVIRKAATKAGKTAIEQELYPEIRKNIVKSSREEEIRNVLKRLDWNILSTFLHMRATPCPATMFDIFKVKAHYASTNENDLKAIAINLHRSMGIQDPGKISTMIDEELHIKCNPDSIQSWIDSYNEYSAKKKAQDAVTVGK